MAGGLGFGVKKAVPTKPVIVLEDGIKFNPLHWNRVVLEKQKQNVVWAQVKEESFDLAAFKELFKKETKEKAVVDEDGEKKRDVTHHHKVKNVSVLDYKRATQVGIALSRLPGPSVIIDAVRTLDDRKLTREQVETLISIAPSADELFQVREVNGPDVALAPPEEYFAITESLPHMQLRLKAWLFRYTFEDQYLNLESKLVLLLSACAEVRDSKILPKLFGLVLATGNYLNAGNTRTGQADGFELPCLLKIAEQRGKDSTLLEFVVQQYAQDTSPSVVPIAKLVDELSCARKCGGLEIVEMQTEVSRLESLVRATRANVDKVAADPSVHSDHSDPFRHAMPELLAKSIDRMETLKALLTKIVNEFKLTCDFYGGKPKTSGEFFDVFHHFAKQVQDVLPKIQPVKLNATVEARARGKIGERIGGSEDAMAVMIQQLKAGALKRNIKSEGASPRA